jgi:hypothetical protein
MAGPQPPRVEVSPRSISGRTPAIGVTAARTMVDSIFIAAGAGSIPNAGLSRVPLMVTGDLRLSGLHSLGS